MQRKAGLVAVWLFAGFGAAAVLADDDPPQPTQEQVLANMVTEKAPDQATKAEPPQPIHPLNKADRKALKDEHRVVSGSRWGALSPQERDSVMRSFREANAPGTIFVIDVRTGDVYRFDPLPPTDDPAATTEGRLSDQYHVHITKFTDVDLAKLPTSVGQAPVTHDDIRGEIGELARAPVEGPP